MNTKGIKFLAVLAVLAMAFAAIAVLDVQQKGAVEGDAVDVAKIGDTGYKTLEEAIAAATGESTEIVLLMDVTATLADFTQDEGASEKTIAIDLAGYTLTLGNTDGILIENGVKLIFNNGKILANNMPDGTRGVFCPQTGSSVEINKVTFDTNGTAFYPRGDAAKVVIEDSKVTAGTYAVGTNAATLDNYGVKIIINKSTLISTCYADDDGDTCTVMLNVAGSLNITDSTINGKRQAVFVRAGDAVLENVNVEFEPNFATPGKYKPDDTWKSGNEVPEAAIVIGNDRDSAFKADANVTLNNVAVTIKQNENESKQCFDVLWIEDYKKTEEETTVDTYKTNVNIDNLTVPATGIVTIKAGTVNETNITAEGLTAGAKGMTISKGSVVLSGDIDGGEITGDVTFKDANILGELTLNGNITIDGKVNLDAGSTITLGEAARIKFAVPESEDDGLVFLTGNVPAGATAVMDLPIISGSSDNDLRELGCPVITIDGDLYIVFTVKFGSSDTAKANYGLWYNAINYTGEEITTDKIQQSVIALDAADRGSFHDLSRIEKPGTDVGIYTYPNTANFSHAQYSVPLSVIVPYEIVPAPSDSLFVEKDMTIGEKTIGSTEITQPTDDDPYKVTFTSEVNYIPETDEFKAGYYVAFGLTQLDGTAIPEGAEVKIDGEAIPQIEGVYYIYLTEGVQTETPISVKVVVDYDTTEVANFKTANYDVTIIPTTVNLVSFAVADDEVNYWEASTIEKPEKHKIAASEFGEIEVGTMTKKQADEPTNVSVYQLTITAKKLNYVYNYTDFSSVAAEQNGYYVPYTMKLSKAWADAGATVYYQKTCTVDGTDDTVVGERTYEDFDGEVIAIIHGANTVITYTVTVDGSTTQYEVTFVVEEYEADAKYDKAADGTKNPYGRAYTDDIGEVIYMVYANVDSAPMNQLTGKAYYIGDKTEWDGTGEPVKTEEFTDTADNNTIDHTWYFNPVDDNGNDFEEGRYCLVIYGPSTDPDSDEPKEIARAYVVYGTMASLIDVVEYEGEEIDSDYYVAQFAADVIENEEGAAYDYTVDMTGTLLHYVPANGTDKPGFYLVFQLNYGDKIITDNTSVIFDDTSAKKVSTGVYRVYLGADYSALAKPTFTVDIDGDEEVFESSSYIINTEGIDFPVMTIVLHDSYIGDDGAVDYEDVYANVKEGQPYRLPNGKDSSRVLDRWVFNGSTPEYAYDSIYMPKNVDADPETGYIEFTAVYKGSEPVPPQPQEDYSEDVSVAVNKVDGGVRVVVAAIDGKLVKGETIKLFCEYWAEDEDGIMELVKFTLTGTVAGDNVVTFTTIPTDGNTIAYMNAVYGDGLAESGVIVF